MDITLPTGSEFVFQGKLLHCIVEKVNYTITSADTSYNITDEDVFYLEGLDTLTNVDLTITKDGITNITFDAPSTDIIITAYKVKQMLATAKEVSVKSDISTEEKELDCSFQTISIPKSIKYTMDFTDYFTIGSDITLSELSGSLVDYGGTTVWKAGNPKYVDFMTLVYDGEVDTNTVPKKGILTKEVIPTSIELSVSAGEKKMSCNVKDVAIITY